MKILELVATADPYGAARYADGLSRALSDLGHEVHRVQCTDRRFPFVAYSDPLQLVLDSLPRSEEMVALWEKHGPFDAVLAHEWPTGLTASTARRVFEIPLVSVMHGTQAGRCEGKGTREELFVADMERWMCRESDRVVAVSDHVRGELESRYQIPGAKVSVVPGGVDVHAFSGEVDREEFREVFAEPDEALVLFAGRLIPSKGPDLFVETCPHILRRNPSTKFAMAGQGPMQAALISHARDLGLAERFRLTGHLGPVVLGALYQVADVLVVPSRYEALGSVVLEAALHGLPAVATRAGGLCELGKHLRKEQMVHASAEPRDLAAEVVRVLQKKPVSEVSRAPEADRIPLLYRSERTANAVEEILKACRLEMATT